MENPKVFAHSAHIKMTHGASLGSMQKVIFLGYWCFLFCGKPFECLLRLRVPSPWFSNNHL